MTCHASAWATGGRATRGVNYNYNRSYYYILAKSKSHDSMKTALNRLNDRPNNEMSLLRMGYVSLARPCFALYFYARNMVQKGVLWLSWAELSFRLGCLAWQSRMFQSLAPLVMHQIRDSEFRAIVTEHDSQRAHYWW